MAIKSSLSATLAALLIAIPAAYAQGGSSADPADTPIYGRQLMTMQEQNEFRDRMRNATSVEERNRIQAEHHTQMQARAKERGVTLPDQPPHTPGTGMGQGQGQGQGPRDGSGRGQGGSKLNGGN